MRLLARLPYDAIFTTVYAGLKLNLCLAVAASPLLLAVMLSGQSLRAWPFFTVLSAICAPAVAAAFGAFRGLSEGDHRVGRAFWACYGASFWRSLAVGAAAASAVIVLAVDFHFAFGGPFAAATPMLVLLAGMVAAVTTAALGIDAGLRPKLLLPLAYLVLRRWYLSLVNLAVLGILCVAVGGRPAIGLLLLPAPVLYVVWTNTRHITAPMDSRDSAGTDSGVEAKDGVAVEGEPYVLGRHQ